MFGSRQGPHASLTNDDLLYLLNLFRQIVQTAPGTVPVTPFPIVGPGNFSPNETNARWLLVDSTGGPVTITYPTPSTNEIFLVSDWKGKSAINPINLVAPATWTISNPANPGNTAAPPAFATISQQGANAWFISVVSLKQLIQVV